ncbi:putative barnase/colicin E5 family endoribonuclease [Campylobacter lanienae]|uniref:putative barnase/colicin E5 family endoribonuclease n=1 Tax=Campylobacter lanienae TaxID=75658 RepID=UPI0036F438B7
MKGYGLSKIEAKHLNDFAIFKGDTPQEKLINGIAEIIEKGEIKPRSGQNGVNIEYNGFIIGINKGFNGAGDNKWVVTAFDNSISKSEKKAKTARTDNFTSEVNNLSQNSKSNSTPKEIKSQAQKVEQKAKQYAKWLSQADKIPPQAPDELYKAYDKAKKDLKPKK